MSTLDVRQHLDNLNSFVSRGLPSLNTSCRDHSIRLETWLRAVSPELRDVAQTVQQLSSEERLDILQLLGLILHSGERHAQFAGHSPGWVVQQLAGFEQAMVMAAENERVPALTAELYWERNTGPTPLTFTGERHERFFISAVRTQVALRSTVNNHLRQLVSGEWHPDTSAGARLMYTAVTAMAEAHGQYQDFRRGPEGHPLMTPQEFNEMRVWLAPTVIGGRELAGPNAAYIAEMATTDYLLGTADVTYDAYVRGFTPLTSPEGRKIFARDRARVPLSLVLADALGFGETEFDIATDTEVAERIMASPRAMQWTLLTFKEFFEEFVGASGTHIGLVNVYLRKYAESLSSEEIARMPVAPTTGTGGHAHEHTQNLHDMRRTSPRVRKLISALRHTRITEYELAGTLWRRSK